MSFSKANASSATLTTTRSDVAPISGMCVTCVDGCSGPCEIGRSALSGREVIYPQPFAKVTAGSEKDYPIDYSHFDIQGTCVGAVGTEADPDKAIFPAVDVTTTVGTDGSIKMRLPVFTGALGSTDIARVHWEAMAIGAAIGGVLVVVGENVCGMDPELDVQNGRVVRSPEMERRVNTYKEWYDGWGGILVQYNVEDGRLGVPEYVVEKLGVETDEHGFCRTSPFSPSSTSRDGVFVAGVFSGPADIPDSVTRACAAASSSARVLSGARGTLTTEKDTRQTGTSRTNAPESASSSAAAARTSGGLSTYPPWCAMPGTFPTSPTQRSVSLPAPSTRRGGSWRPLRRRA